MRQIDTMQSELQLHEGENSLTFPPISTKLLAEAIEQGKKTKNQNKIVNQLRNSNL